MSTDDVWHRQKHHWMKVWDSWWGSQSHLEFDVVTHGVGLRAMMLANLRGRQPDGSALLCGLDGGPLSIDQLARASGATLEQTRTAIEVLLRSGTLAKRPDGMLLFPGMQKAQEDPRTTRRRARNERTPAPKVDPVVADNDRTLSADDPGQRPDSAPEKTEVRREKLEDRREKEKEDLFGPPPPQPLPAGLADLIQAEWNRVLAPLGVARLLSIGKMRRVHLAARIREQPERATESFWIQLIAGVTRSEFLLGRKPPSAGRRPFALTIDWLLESDLNLTKVAEGAYEEKRPPQPSPASTDGPRLTERELQRLRDAQGALELVRAHRGGS